MILILILYVCITPTGWVETFRPSETLAPSVALHRALGGAWHPATDSTCRWTDSVELPSRTRLDPRRPGSFLTQRHRWRGLPDGRVILDTSVKRPHQQELIREIGRVLSEDRRAILAFSFEGATLLKAMQAGEWSFVRAFLRQNEVWKYPLTYHEIEAIRAIGDDYEADLR